MNIQTLWAVALCEIRSCSRLVRTWVVLCLASLVAIFTYIALCAQHMENSTISPSPAIQIPRFIVGESANQFIGLFILGIIFLAFDIRARDVRDRIDGIIDAKPISNLGLVVGRLGGILVLLVVPILVFLSLVLAHGALAGVAGWTFGAPIEIWSVLSFLTWDVVPILAWWGGLVMLLAVVLRNRLLVVLAALGIFVLNMWFVTTLSWGQMEVAGGSVSQVIHPSDVAPVFWTGTIALQRIAWSLMAVGFLATAATFLPRMLPRRAFFGLAGVAAFGAGVLVFVGLFASIDSDTNQKDTWVKVHQMQDEAAFPDVEKLAGAVNIKPGNRIELNLELRVIPPSSNKTEKVVFTLNPGYNIKEIRLDENKIDDYTFQDGLITIPSHYFGTESVTLSIDAEGKPDKRFAYLDATIDLKAVAIMNIRMAMARYLGNQSYVFQPDYVALLPGIHWYPTAGVAVGRDDLRKYAKDHFTTDLTVTVPKNWQVAGPGRAELQTERSNRYSYRFRPKNPISDFAVIGSKFERVVMTVEDIEFELLYSSKHRRTFAAMEPLLPSLREWISERLMIADQYGLNYPYDTLTLVEVPSYLRVLGGGWRMDSTLYAPGMVMIRENGLPTARFDAQFKSQEGEQSFQQLVSYFDRDLQGGNPLIGIARSFITYQMSPTGRGANALNLFIEDLVMDLLVERLPFFTTGTALNLSPVGRFDSNADDDGVSVSISVGNPGVSDQRRSSGTMNTRNRNIHNLNSWSKIEETSVSDLNYSDEPVESYEAALLRNTYALATLKDWIGDEALGRFLRVLIQKFRGRNFVYEDFLQVVTEHEPSLKDFTQNWLDTNKLPGYVVSEASIEKLKTNEPNSQIFQTAFYLRNAESVPGFVTVRWKEERGFGTGEEDSTIGMPMLLLEPESSYQIAIKSNLEPTEVWVEVPMSLNRRPIELALPSLDEIPERAGEPLPDVTAIQWNPIPSDQVVVDDLDQGFSVTGEPKERELPWFVPRFLVEMGTSLFEEYESVDRGLPTYSDWRTETQWTRAQGSGFGRYRNTYARVPSVSDNAGEEVVFMAEFATDLPNSGTWELEYSVPSRILTEELIRVQVDSDSESNDDASTPSNTAPVGLTVQVNDQTIPIEMDLFELKSEVDTKIGDIRINRENLSERLLSSLVRSIERQQEKSDASLWLKLGSFNIVDPYVVVRISNKNSLGHTFADAVRWTYVGDRDSD